MNMRKLTPLEQERVKRQISQKNTQQLLTLGLWVAGGLFIHYLMTGSIF